MYFLRERCFITNVRLQHSHLFWLGFRDPLLQPCPRVVHCHRAILPPCRMPSPCFGGLAVFEAASAFALATDSRVCWFTSFVASDREVRAEAIPVYYPRLQGWLEQFSWALRYSGPKPNTSIIDLVYDGSANKLLTSRSRAYIKNEKIEPEAEEGD